MFAKPLREKNCVTILDPFNEKYGKVLTVGVSIFTLLLDFMNLPLILIALGKYIKTRAVNLFNNIYNEL